MNFAFVTELFYPSVGGQEVRFEELGRALVARGHRVHLYTIHTDRNSPAFENRGGIEVSRLCPSSRYKLRHFRRNPLVIARFGLSLWRRRTELAAYDAVIFNLWPILPQVLLGPRLREKCVVDVCETRSGPFWHAVYRSFASIPGVRLLGVNQAIVGEMVRCFGIEPSRCATIVSGVDLLAAGEPPLSKSRRQILFFGRMATHKNPQLLVEAFHESGIQREGFHLEMAGGGPELERLRRDSSFSGITYHGLVSEEEKWNLLRQSSLLVMPSRREGFPRVVAEAACVGTPTLALDFPGNGTCSVVRDYSIGRVCAPTREALVEELRAFAKGADYLDMAQHCQSVARTQFSWDTVSDKLVEFLGAKEN